MKREILFRAQRKDGKGWVYGDLRQTSEGCYISSNTSRKKLEPIFTLEPIIPETISQFTGFKDKHDQLIFEADLLHTAGYYCEVKFIDGMFCSVYNHPEDGETLPLVDLSPERFEIIGNTHES